MAIDDYILNCKNVIQQGNELRKVIDNYWLGEEKEQVVREYLYYVADNGLMFEDNEEMNKTVKKILGARRCKLIKKLLENHHYQFKL